MTNTSSVEKHLLMPFGIYRFHDFLFPLINNATLSVGIEVFSYRVRKFQTIYAAFWKIQNNYVLTTITPMIFLKLKSFLRDLHFSGRFKPKTQKLIKNIWRNRKFIRRTVEYLNCEYLQQSRQEVSSALKPLPLPQKVQQAKLKFW